MQVSRRSGHFALQGLIDPCSLFQDLKTGSAACLPAQSPWVPRTTGPDSSPRLSPGRNPTPPLDDDELTQPTNCAPANSPTQIQSCLPEFILILYL